MSLWLAPVVSVKFSLETHWGLAQEAHARREDALKTEEETISARLLLCAALWRHLGLQDASSQ